MSFKFRILSYAAILVLVAALVPLPSLAGQTGTPITANGFTFTNFDPSLAGLAGSNANGISNRGHVVITAFNNNGAFSNFEGTPSSLSPLSLSSTGMALGINSGGEVVGTNNGAAFFMPPHGTPQTFTVPANTTSALGINDEGSIVGQFMTPSGTNPGFYLRTSTSGTFVTINAPSGPNVVNAQSINNFGLIVGFYVGNDGQYHGFIANASKTHNGILTGTPVADPVIPNVAGRTRSDVRVLADSWSERRRDCCGILRRLHR